MSRETRTLRVLALVFIGLVVVEVAILVPVVVVLRADEAADATVQLNQLTDRIAGIINTTLDLFYFTVIRSSVALSLVSGFVSESVFETVLQRVISPVKAVYQRYYWIQLVTFGLKGAFERFADANIRPGFRITQLNGSTLVPVPPRPLYAPFSLFDPFDALVNGSGLVGFDALSYPPSQGVLTNATLKLVTHVTLGQRNPNSFGLLFIAKSAAVGYMMGLVDTESVLTFALPIDRSDIQFIAFDTGAPSGKQLLFRENASVFENVTSISDFERSPIYSEFYVRIIAAPGNRTFLIGCRYASAYAASFAGTYWIVVVAVLVPVFCCLDAGYVIVVLILLNYLRLERIEKTRRLHSQLMLGYVNHEIRNPLQTILGLADLTVESLQDAGSELYEVRLALNNLETIIRAAEFIEHIASDVLDLRKIEEGKLEVVVEPIKVTVLVSGLVKAVQGKAAPGVEFIVDVEPGLRTIRSDRYRLEQILMNFLTNAFKYTSVGYVRLSIRKIDDDIELAVTDTGRGIPDDKKGTIFQQFGQVAATDASHHGGFGLGLHLCQLLAKLLGAEIGFESVEWKGSRFWIKLIPIDASRTIDEQFHYSALHLSHKRNE